MRFDSLIAPGYRRAVYSRDGEGTARRRACRLFETAYPRFGRRRLCQRCRYDPCDGRLGRSAPRPRYGARLLQPPAFDPYQIFRQRLPDELPFSDRYGQPRETAQHSEPSALQQHLAFASGRLVVAADRGHTPRTYRVRRFQRYAPILHLPPHVARIAGCFPREGTGILAYLSGILQYVPHRLRAGFRRFRGAFVRGAVRRVFGSPPVFVRLKYNSQRQ